jgi:hypothetical protein
MLPAQQQQQVAPNSMYAGGGYSAANYPPHTIAMRQAPQPSEPYLQNPFHSRPSSPAKQQQAAPNYQPMSDVRSATGNAHPAPADSYRAGSVLPEAFHGYIAPSAIQTFRPSYYQPSVSVNHHGGVLNNRGASLAVPVAQQSTFMSAAPQSGYLYSSSAASAVQADIANAAMAHYQQRLDDRRAQEQKLAQEEAALAAEETALLSKLEQLTSERRLVDDEHAALCRGWSQMFSQQQWYEQTPDLDLTADVAEAQYRCQAMQQHLDELRFVLEGHQTELRKFDGNSQVLERQRLSMRKLDECLEEMEKRRHGYRKTAEAHFDAEAQRERGCRSYLVEIKGRAQDLEARLNAAGAAIPWAVAGTSSRTSSVAQQQHYEEPQSSTVGLSSLPVNTGPRSDYSGKGHALSSVPFRQRVVSFRGNSDPSAQASSLSGGGQHLPIDIDGASFTVALDEESFYSKTGDASNDMDDVIGLNGGSFAMNLCDTKRRRPDYALTAM